MAFNLPVSKYDNLTSNNPVTTFLPPFSFDGYTNTERNGFAVGAEPTRINEKPGETYTPVSSQHNVKPLPRDFHLKMARGEPLFLLNPMMDMNSRVFRVMPLWYLNYELEQAARLKAARGQQRKRPHEDEWSEQFPTTVEEFIQKITPFGCLEATMEMSGHSTRLFVENNPYRVNSGLHTTISHRGQMQVPNYWGAIQGGDEVGFAAVMTNGFYDKMYSPDGSSDENKTTFDFLQVLPVWSSNKNRGAVIMPFRPEHFTQNKGMGSLSYQYTKTMPTYDFATQNNEIQFGRGKSRVGEIQLQDFEVGHYFRLGIVIKTNTKVPQDHEIKRGLRDYGASRILKNRCMATIHLEPDMPLYKTI